MSNGIEPFVTFNIFQYIHIHQFSTVKIHCFQLYTAIIPNLLSRILSKHFGKRYILKVWVSNQNLTCWMEIIMETFRCRIDQTRTSYTISHTMILIASSAIPRLILSRVSMALSQVLLLAWMNGMPTSCWSDLVNLRHANVTPSKKY